MKVSVLFISVALILTIFSVSCGILNQPDKLSHIKDMAWQEEKYLWISGNDELIRWNTQTKESETFKNISGEFLVDSKNILWVFDRGIINHFDEGSWEHFRSGEDFADGQILSFVETNGYIWVGARGLSRYNQQNQSWEILFHTTPGPEPTPIPEDVLYVEALVEGLHSMAPANEEALWLGTNRGLTRWEDDMQQSWGNDALNTDGIRCLLGISESEVWICTERGFGRWDGIEMINFFEDHGEHKELVQGDAHEVWAIGDKGVSRWNGFSWDNWTIIQEPDLPAEQEVDLPLNVDSLESAFSLVVSSTDSNIWVIFTGGIARWNGQQWRVYTSDDGLMADSIHALTQDSRGFPWAGTNNGIYYYDPDTDRWKAFP